MCICISLIKYVICRFFLLRNKQEPSEFCFSQQQFASYSLSVGWPWHRVESHLSTYIKVISGCAIISWWLSPCQCGIILISVVIRESMCLCLRCIKDLSRYERGNTLMNTGYGKSRCRVFGKLGTDHTLLHTAQERTRVIPSLLSSERPQQQTRSTASIRPDRPRSWTERIFTTLVLQETVKSARMTLSTLCFSALLPTPYFLRSRIDNKVDFSISAKGTTRILTGMLVRLSLTGAVLTFLQCCLPVYWHGMSFCLLLAPSILSAIFCQVPLVSLFLLWLSSFLGILFSVILLEVELFPQFFVRLFIVGVEQRN